MSIGNNTFGNNIYSPNAGLLTPRAECGNFDSSLALPESKCSNPSITGKDGRDARYDLLTKCRLYERFKEDFELRASLVFRILTKRSNEDFSFHRRQFLQNNAAP